MSSMKAEDLGLRRIDGCNQRLISKVVSLQISINVDMPSYSGFDKFLRSFNASFAAASAFPDRTGGVRHVGISVRAGRHPL